MTQYLSLFAKSKVGLRDWVIPTGSLLFDSILANSASKSKVIVFWLRPYHFRSVFLLVLLCVFILKFGFVLTAYSTKHFGYTFESGFWSKI